MAITKGCSLSTNDILLKRGTEALGECPHNRLVLHVIHITPSPPPTVGSWIHDKASKAIVTPGSPRAPLMSKPNVWTWGWTLQNQETLGCISRAVASRMVLSTGSERGSNTQRQLRHTAMQRSCDTRWHVSKHPGTAVQLAGSCKPPAAGCTALVGRSVIMALIMAASCWQQHRSGPHKLTLSSSSRTASLVLSMPNCSQLVL